MGLLDYYTKQELENIIKESYSLKEVLAKLGYSTVGGNNFQTLKRRIISFNIDISHFKTKTRETRSIENIFVENSTASQRTLRVWYEKGKYTEYKCSICGQEPVWNDNPLTLILDHINGINNDDRLENLRWVCPNCNQQLETTGHSLFHTTLKTSKTTKQNKCKCGKSISPKAKLCIQCHSESRRRIPPIEKDKLLDLLKRKTFAEIGKMYGVTGNAVRKWCKKYNLPTKKKI